MNDNDSKVAYDTFRIELSCLVFRVSYPSRRQQRTVDPEPANSARFRSAKPSCKGNNNDLRETERQRDSQDGGTQAKTKE